MSHQLLLSIRDAMVIYKEKPVFENLDLNIHQGLRTALIGKNGAGKSTIMKIIYGIKSGPTNKYILFYFRPANI